MCHRFSIVGLSFFTMLVPTLLGGNVRRGICDGDICFELSLGPVANFIFTSLRFLCVMGLYVGFIAVTVSMMLIKNDQLKTQPELSIAAQMIISLIEIYFFVFAGHWLCLCLKQFLNNSPAIQNAVDAFDLGSRKSSFFKEFQWFCLPK